MISVQLADVSTRCSSHPQGKGEVRCQNAIDWQDTKMLYKATRPVELLVKEALCIQRTPANNRLNRSGGLRVTMLLDHDHEEIRGRGQRRPHSSFGPCACACTSSAPIKLQHFDTPMP